MIRVENDCCGCAVPGYPCRGSSCPLRHMPHCYCDNCGTEIYEDEFGFDVDNDYTLCEECYDELEGSDDE